MMPPLPGGVVVRGDRAAWAAVSACGTYRYALGRQWEAGRPVRVVVMLNPSTADHLQDDATLRAVLRRARAEGAGALRVANLYALRSRDPARLRQVDDPAGPLNEAAILAVTAGAGAVLCAWGAAGAWQGRGAAVAALLRAQGRVVQHLGLTRAGQPRHPLYLSGGVAVQDWQVVP